MKRIGLSQRVQVVADYNERRDALDQRWHELILGLGCLPVALPNVDCKYAQRLISEYQLDGVILTGGNSLHMLDPESQNTAPERDKFEIELLTLAVKKNFPILGVCRGMQLINVYFGGQLKRVWGHVAVEHGLEVMSADLELPSLVNSYHEWCIPSTDLAADLEVLACDASGNVEAFRHQIATVYGIMWHPERSLPLTREEANFFGKIFL